MGMFKKIMAEYGNNIEVLKSLHYYECVSFPLSDQSKVSVTATCLNYSLDTETDQKNEFERLKKELDLPDEESYYFFRECNMATYFQEDPDYIAYKNKEKAMKRNVIYYSKYIQ